MPGDDQRDDRAVARTIAVIVLVMLATLALRGRIPGAETAAAAAEAAESESGGAGTLFAVVAMLAVSMAVIAIAILNQTRRPAAAVLTLDGPRDSRGPRSRPPWRLLAIAAAGLLAWLLLIVLLMQWGARLDDGAVEAATSPPAETGTPTAESGPVEPPEPPDAGGGQNVFWALMAATIALLVLSFAATVASRRRPPGTEAPPPHTTVTTEPEPTGPDLVRAAELGLAEIGDRSRDPREAIIACYVAMEHELEKSPGTIPQASDTPSEVLARAVRSHALRADSATELVDLFEEARFSPHVMDEGHRADAVRALRMVLGELEAAR